MSVAAILSPERVGLFEAPPGRALSKHEVLERLSTLVVRGPSLEYATAPSRTEVLRVLVERERMQSTGVGLGVAIPHGTIDGLAEHVGALLVCRPGVAFDAIDGKPVSVVFGLLGPRGSAALHLKHLARIARLMRDDVARERLAAAANDADLFERVIGLERSDEHR